MKNNLLKELTIDFEKSIDAKKLNVGFWSTYIELNAWYMATYITENPNGSSQNYIKEKFLQKKAFDFLNNLHLDFYGAKKYENFKNFINWCNLSKLSKPTSLSRAIELS